MDVNKTEKVDDDPFVIFFFLNKNVVWSFIQVRYLLQIKLVLHFIYNLKATASRVDSRNIAKKPLQEDFNIFTLWLTKMIWNTVFFLYARNIE